MKELLKLIRSRKHFNENELKFFTDSFEGKELFEKLFILDCDLFQKELNDIQEKRFEK